MQSKNNLILYSISFLIIIGPFLNLIHFLIPIYILGKSLWTVGPAVIYFIIFLLNTIKVTFKLIMTFLLFILIFFIIYIRSNYYLENRSYFDFRFFVTIPIYLFLANNLKLKFYNFDKIISFSLFLQGFLASFFFIINVQFFPHVLISIDEFGDSFLNTDGIRTRSMLLSASISANMILIGMFTLLYIYEKSILKFNFYLLILTLIIMIYAIMLSGSRFPQLIGLLILIYSFKKVSTFKMIITFLLISIFLTLYFSFFQFEAIFRFNEDSGGRFDKVLLPIQLLLQNPMGLLIGVSSDLAGNAISDNGVGISDNSYLLVVLLTGIFISFFYFTLIFSFINPSNKILLYKIYVVYFILSFGVTNCILWEMWVSASIFAIILLNNKSNPELNFVTN